MSFRSVMQKKLLSLREDMEKIGCQFWACPGPDEPFRDMATCYRCHCIQSVNSMLKDLDEN